MMKKALNILFFLAWLASCAVLFHSYRNICNELVKHAALFERIEQEYFKKTYPGEPAVITNEIGRPYSVLTIDYGERPLGFVEGDVYVLKCLKVRGTKIDYGFCPIKELK